MAGSFTAEERIERLWLKKATQQDVLDILHTAIREAVETEREAICKLIESGECRSEAPTYAQLETEEGILCALRARGSRP